MVRDSIFKRNVNKLWKWPQITHECVSTAAIIAQLSPPLLIISWVLFYSSHMSFFCILDRQTAVLTVHTLLKHNNSCRSNIIYPHKHIHIRVVNVSGKCGLPAH